MRLGAPHGGLGCPTPALSQIRSGSCPTRGGSLSAQFRSVARSRNPMLKPSSSKSASREASNPVVAGGGRQDSTATDLELESVDYFVSFAQMMGFPKSIGQIYGLLFMSFEPIPMDEVIEKLSISKGSVSQGLSLLRDLGAVKVTNVEGDRRDFFYADFDVSRIVKHFLDEKLSPRLSHAEDRLEWMRKLASELPEESAFREVAESRLQALQKWQNRGKRLLPLFRRFFSL